MVAVALFALFAAVPTELKRPDFDAPKGPVEPRFVIDLYPQSTTAALAAGATVMALAVHLPVSVTVPISDSTAIHAQVSATYVNSAWARNAGWSFSASAGPLFSFGDTALDGLYLCPQFTFLISSAMMPLGQTRTNGPIDVGPEWARAFLGGLEVGYQWTWEGRHIAIMTGASAGYQYDGFVFVSELGLNRGGGRGTPPRSQGFAFSLNTNLFRIGFAL